MYNCGGREPRYRNVDIQDMMRPKISRMVSRGTWEMGGCGAGLISVGAAFAMTAQTRDAMSIVRDKANGGLLALVPRRMARREELSFSFGENGVANVEPGVDPV